MLYYFHSRVIYFLLLLVVLPAFGEGALELTEGKSTLVDTNLWYEFDNVVDVPRLQAIKSLESVNSALQTAQTMPSLGGESGTYFTKVTLSIPQKGQYFVIVNANFIDVGLASYSSSHQPEPTFQVFSQLRDNATPPLLHFQAITVQTTMDNEQIALRLLIKAKQFPTPVSISVLDSRAFYQFQKLNNGISIAGITSMLILALLAVLIYSGTRKRVALTCAGYLGLHGVGWAAASGMLNDIVSLPINTSYWGMLIFPLAIASAAQFVSDLFECKADHKKLFTFLRCVSVVSFVLGITMWFMPFTLAYLLSHLLAMFWIVFTIVVGVSMLKKNDFRAKYFLAGNLVYSLSLGYYIAAHSLYFGELPYPESAVIFALSLDCLCILLCLTEWFKLKQKEFTRNQYLSRIDSMTQLGNRFSLSECIGQIADDYVIVYIDLDGLKSINDRNGHDEGDKLIIKTASLLQQSFYSLGDVFRSGGDEFVVVLQANSAHGIQNAADKALAQMSHVSIELGKQWHDAGVSFGIATSLEAKGPSECISLADKRMYQHKAKTKYSNP
ncbi:putative signaling protein [Paraglaciecola mesophila]|uniref:Putative signaling protein n=1 Tax=Paraglaciecola mesophila TaxID=197222 RepID=A0A857JPK3_9ALTE|nr:diguanylate cyclase [Paraglaciecola mesophila]QHJ12877.1 putative signaling protein [Paraglaciecola mesophila]